MDNCPFLDACTKALHGPGLECKDGCAYHRFAVLVNNQAITNVEHILVVAGLPTINKRCQALIMEVPS